MTPETKKDATYDALWSRKVSAESAEIPARIRSAARAAGKGERLLDVGCGNGLVGRVLKDAFTEIHGVEFSEPAVETAKKAGVLAQLCDLNAGVLPYPADHFDVVVMLDVIEHLVDPEPLLKELGRVVKPGGRIVVTTPNVRSVKQLARIAVSGRGPRTSGDDFGVDGGHLHYFTFNDVDDLLRRAGLKVVSREGIVARFPEQFRALAKAWIVREFVAGGLLVVATKA